MIVSNKFKPYKKGFERPKKFKCLLNKKVRNSIKQQIREKIRDNNLEEIITQTQAGNVGLWLD